MTKKFTEAFKKQVVEKALNHSKDISLEDLASELGIGHSTLRKWIKQFSGSDIITEQEKRPHEWSTKQRLEALQATYGLSESDVSAYCRQHGI